MTLDNLQENEVATIVEINNEELAIKLLSMGFIIGEEINLIRKAPLKDPLIVSCGSNQISIRKKDAKNICIKKL